MFDSMLKAIDAESYFRKRRKFSKGVSSGDQSPFSIFVFPKERWAFSCFHLRFFLRPSKENKVCPISFLMNFPYHILDLLLKLF